MAIIDGRSIAEKIRADLKTRAAKFERANGRKRGLAVILVGNDAPSEIYVRTKERACADVGITSFVHKLPEKSKQSDIIALIDRLNADKNVDGILVQLPLPRHIDKSAIIERITPSKDVDGLTSANVGALALGRPGHIPCTALGVIELIKSTGVQLVGAHAVVVGRSNLVGKPTAQLLLNSDCTVTIAHRHTKKLGAITRVADILVVAVGHKHLITADMVKPNAVVIDVGITRKTIKPTPTQAPTSKTHDEIAQAPTSKIYGDVDFDAVQSIASYISPPTGGVGPMTVAMLLRNTLV